MARLEGGSIKDRCLFELPPLGVHEHALPDWTGFGRRVQIIEIQCLLVAQCRDEQCPREYLDFQPRNGSLV